MKLITKETKKAIKNNQVIKFTLFGNNKTALSSNKKYYKRYVKAVVQKIKSFYPALTSAKIVDELEQLEILPNVSCFDKEGYLIRGGKQSFVKNSTFIVKNNKIELSYCDRNDKYFLVDQELGMKLDDDIAVSDPFTNRFAILLNDPNRLSHVTDKELPLLLNLSINPNGTFNIVVDGSVFAGTKSKLVNLDKQKIARKEYEAELENIRNKIFEINRNIEPLFNELIPKLSEKVIKTQKIISSEIVKSSFNELSNNFYKSISKKLELRSGNYSIELSSPHRWPQEGDYGGALYREYDGTLCVQYELANKYIEKNYSKEIKTIKAEIEKLNKKMTKKSPIKFEISYGISVGDKTANVYAAISLKKLPQEVDAKYFHKMEKVLN